MRGVARGTAALASLTMLSLLLSVPASAAASSPVPADVRFVSSWTDPLTGLRWDRYQQFAAPLGVFVDGAQLIVISSGSRVVAESGTHYPDLRVTAKPALSPAQAIAAATAQSTQTSRDQQSTVAVTQAAQLRVDPSTARQFYRVTSAAPGHLLYQDIDASTGALLQSWSGLEMDSPPTGSGVKTDTKSLGGDALTGSEVLTSTASSGWKLVSSNDDFETVDAGNTTNYPSTPMTDGDNSWVGSRQHAAVDAQYYAALTDNFYRSRFNFDLTGPTCLDGPIVSIVHYARKYDNAFWDPDAHVMVYGDGNGSTDSQMSGAQDVVSHELSHAVTSCHSNLDYTKESGALNEAFSDIMATTAEFESEEPNSSHCVRESGQATCADWWLGEDLVIGGSDHAFRSLAHPQVLGQPSHYAQRVNPNTNPSNCNQFNDYCGVHTNSGIANHAFYLLTHGGRNARCSVPTDPQADCDVLVPGMGIDHASNIFLRGFFQLTNTSNFCSARTASINAAQMLVDAPTAGYTQSDVAATELAWDAVGVYCPSAAPFQVSAEGRAPATQPDGSTQLTLSISRHTSTGPITFSIDNSAPATSSFTPNPSPNGTTSATLQLNVAADAAPGIYPTTVTATDGSASQRVPLVLVVDTDAPTAIVRGVTLATGDTVATNGKVPLHVDWTTSDATSGVASGVLSVDSTQVATGLGGPTTYSSADGAHELQASAIDEAGNSAASSVFPVTQSSAQESATVLTRKWTTSTGGSAWGTTKFSKTIGATAVYQFTGTDVAWVSSRGPKRGKAKVYIDGVLRAVVDLKSANPKSSVIVFAADGLTAGQHTIKVYVKGTAGRPRVDVDGFIVLSQ